MLSKLNETFVVVVVVDLAQSVVSFSFGVAQNVVVVVCTFHVPAIFWIVYILKRCNNYKCV